LIQVVNEFVLKMNHFNKIKIQILTETVTDPTLFTSKQNIYITIFIELIIERKV